MHDLAFLTEDRSDRLHGVNPRVKLIASIAVLILVLSAGGWAFPLTVAASCFLVALWSGVSFASYLRRFSEPAFLLAVLLLIKALTTPGVPVLTFSLFGFHPAVTMEGLHSGFLLASRILASVSVLVLFGMTTTFSRTLSALAWLRLPRTFVEILMLCYRYIFVLVEDAQVIYHSQRNRLGYAGLFRALRSFGTLAGSVLIRALDQSTNVATAMVQRGYTGRLPHGEEERPSRVEVAAATLLVALFTVCFATMEQISR